MTEEKKVMPAASGERQSAEGAERMLPDGIGLTVEEVRELLHRKHNTSIPVDDPVLMFVTIMNAVLTEQEKLHARHREALTGFMAELTEAYAAEVREGAETVTATLSALTAKGLNEAARDMVKFRTTLFLCTAISAVSALLIVAVFVLKGM